MYHINKCTFFHGLLIAMISVCNYFIKINDSMAAACGTVQMNSCRSRCGSLSVLSCDYNGNAVSCKCGCDSYLLAEYGDMACQYATQAHGSCSNGGYCSFSACSPQQLYCFSYYPENCDYGNVRCRKTHLFDMAATSRACSCQYYSSYSGSPQELCKDSKYYGSSCQYTCPSYMYSASMYVNGRRSNATLGGAQTDCYVMVPSACDSTGCFSSHTCYWQN